jgi:elongation factor 2
VASLRITDGAIVVVDAIEGVCVQTNILLRQAMAERVKPVLMLNKCDRLFVERQLSAHEAYDCLLSTLGKVNAIIEDEGAKLGMAGEAVERWKVFLEDGSAIIGSGYFGWAFDVDHVIGRIVRAKSGRSGIADGAGVCETTLKAMLQKWKGVSRQEFRQSFVNRLLKPLATIHRLCLTEATSSLSHPDMAAFLARQNVNISQITPQEISMATKPKELLRLLMRTWSPASACVVKLIASHLPSPEEAQRTRVQMFYTAPAPSLPVASLSAMPEESTTGKGSIVQAMETCDPTGPVMLYVTKVVQLGGSHGGIAVGRLFSGRMQRGAALSLLRPGLDAGSGDSAAVKLCHVKRLLQLKGGKTAAVESVQAGDIFGLALSKVEDNLRGSTLTSHPLPTARGDLTSFAPLPLKASPIVRVAVKARQGGEHASKLRAALKALGDGESCLQVSVDHETGEIIVAGAGELHLETAMHSLRVALGEGIPLQITPPMVSYRETVVVPAEGPACLAKTMNKLNRVYVVASRLSDDLVQEIQNGTLSTLTVAERTRHLVSSHGWIKSHALKIWCFGSEISASQGDTAVAANVLVDATVGLSNMDTLKGDLQVAFQKICEKGPLAGEPLSGVRFDIVDAKIHPDAAHRRTAQILPCGLRVFSAAFLSASPALLEPLYEATIRCQDTTSNDNSSSRKGNGDVGAVYSLLGKYQATVLSHDVECGGGQDLASSSTTVMKASLPVLNAAEFMCDLRAVTKGRAFADVRFDRYALCMEHHHEGKTNPLVTRLRTRNAMPAEVPTLASTTVEL